ncbi:MAG: hypothetical protein LBC25_00635 [Holosporales bacterium]|nr:hypothetical protein [Holosporales bacterium]
MASIQLTVATKRIVCKAAWAVVSISALSSPVTEAFDFSQLGKAVGDFTKQGTEAFQKIWELKQQGAAVANQIKVGQASAEAQVAALMHQANGVGLPPAAPVPVNQVGGYNTGVVAPPPPGLPPGGAVAALPATPTTQFLGAVPPPAATGRAPLAPVYPTLSTFNSQAGYAGNQWGAPQPPASAQWQSQSGPTTVATRTPLGQAQAIPGTGGWGVVPSQQGGTTLSPQPRATGYPAGNPYSSSPLQRTAVAASTPPPPWVGARSQYPAPAPVVQAQPGQLTGGWASGGKL